MLNEYSKARLVPFLALCVIINASRCIITSSLTNREKIKAASSFIGTKALEGAQVTYWRRLGRRRINTFLPIRGISHSQLEGKLFASSQM
jgi:hypothetical protein